MEFTVFQKSQQLPGSDDAVCPRFCRSHKDAFVISPDNLAPSVGNAVGIDDDVMALGPQAFYDFRRNGRLYFNALAADPLPARRVEGRLGIEVVIDGASGPEAA